MQLLLKPCFSFHLICPPTSQFNLAAVFFVFILSLLTSFFTISLLLLLLSGFSMQTLWFESSLIKAAWGNTCKWGNTHECIPTLLPGSGMRWGFLSLYFVDWFLLSRNSLVCCRNATLAAMSAIKIGKMCFLVAENTSPRKCRPVKLGSLPGKSGFFPFISQHWGEKSAIAVIWNRIAAAIWGITCDRESILREIFSSALSLIYIASNEKPQTTQCNCVV